MSQFWYLLEDLSEQPIVVKLGILWGWGSVFVMVLSLISSIST